MADYDARIGRAFPGMVANSRPGDGVTVLCEDVAGMGFGVPVYQGVADNGVTTTVSAKFVGITPSDPVLVHKTADLDRYKKGENATAKRGGVIWVTNGAGAVAKGDPVYVTTTKTFVNAATGGALRAGNSYFDSSAAAGALVKIEINK